VNDEAPRPPPPPSPSAPDGNPYVRAHGTYHRWTAEDVARVRAMLAEQRALEARRARTREPLGPRVYGDARAPFTIGFDVDVLFRNDAGFHHFDGGETGVRLGAFASYDLLTLARDLHLGVELGAGFEHDSAPDLLGSGGKSDLDSQSVHAGVDLRWDALPILSPFARVTGGASFFQLSFAETTPALETAHATSGFGTFGAGVLLHTPPRSFEDHYGSLASFGLGVLIEGGYALRSPADFALHTASDPHAITVVDASLGRLTLSAPYVRTAIVVRF
jgi:hypothetical protein